MYLKLKQHYTDSSANNSMLSAPVLHKGSYKVNGPFEVSSEGGFGNHDITLR